MKKIPHWGYGVGKIIITVLVTSEIKYVILLLPRLLIYNLSRYPRQPILKTDYPPPKNWGISVSNTHTHTHTDTHMYIHQNVTNFLHQELLNVKSIEEIKMKR